MCAGKKQQNKKQICHCRDRVHYAVSDTTPESTPKGWNASYVCRWSIAAGKRPVPFRTRKLSLHTLMVLQPGGCGRVSHRRHQTTKHNSIAQKKGRERNTTVLFPFLGFTEAVVAGRNSRRSACRRFSSSLKFIGIRRPKRTLQDSQLVVSPHPAVLIPGDLRIRNASVTSTYPIV